MESLLNKALAFIIEKHFNQVDKSGQPYFIHPIYVALSMDTEEEKLAALLHDVIEDTDVTEKDLAWLPEEVIEAVKVLTHDKSEDYFKYVNRVKENKMARKVKIADLHHNMDLSRLPSITDKDMERYEKYKKALEMLQ